MSDIHTELPAVVPTLSRGKHRNARKGACFMEFASYLAGERWSDHPSCTHPLLAEAARLVNDHTTDANRSQLAQLIPNVIGLNSDDIRVDARISLTCAQVALPVAAADRQRVLAVAILAAERIFDELDDRDQGTLEEESRTALEQVPQASQWAHGFVATLGFSPRGYRRHAAPKAVRCAVIGVAHACISNPDELLRTLLTRAIDGAAAVVEQEASAAPVHDPAPRSSAGVWN